MDNDYDLLDAWNDLIRLFGADAAPALVVGNPGATGPHRAWVRIPSRGGWTWQPVVRRSKKTHLHVDVFLDEDLDPQ
jgi:hypothetical protein